MVLSPTGACSSARIRLSVATATGAASLFTISSFCGGIALTDVPTASQVQSSSTTEGVAGALSDGTSAARSKRPRPRGQGRQRARAFEQR
ncbi:SLP1 protein [Giardia duodenalis]|uniref:SLP1 protein n=1 Tax=Giardia intestinalis TaxID=5741 RepID=V6TNP9_GIAIN|nr:SLP1 protein [Giardia intestinalis]